MFINEFDNVDINAIKIFCNTLNAREGYYRLVDQEVANLLHRAQTAIWVLLNHIENINEKGE